MKQIAFNRSPIQGYETLNVLRGILRGDTSGDGHYTRQAEGLLRDMHSGANALLTTSCTHALELSGMLLDLKPGDEVIIPAFTFVSTATAFLRAGANLVLCDVDRSSLNLSPQELVKLITPRTKAICVVNYAGVGADLAAIKEIADANRIRLIEDNAHGLGGRKFGKTLGTFGDLSTLSFHETKNISCGEGGAIILNDPTLIERARVLRDKGTNRARFLLGQVDKYTWVDEGSSWVPSDLLASILVSQLRRLPKIQQQRQRVWSTYSQGLSEWAAERGYMTPQPGTEDEHTSHIFHLRLGSSEERRQLISFLAAHKVAAVIHYQSLANSPMGIKLGLSGYRTPIAEHASETLVRLPLHSRLNQHEATRVIRVLHQFVFKK